MFYQQFCREQFDAEGRLIDFSLEYPENFNFGYDAVDAIARQDPDRTALVWEDAEGNTLTYTFGDISRLSNQAANVFLSQGIGKGDRVMLILKRVPEYWYTVVALHKIGAVAVPASFMLTLEDLVYRMRKINISAMVIVSDDALGELVCHVREEAPQLKTVWTTTQNRFGFRSLAEDIAAAPAALERVDTRAEEPMIAYFTSGTTGYPKAVAHSHLYPLTHIVTAKYWQRCLDGGLHLTIADSGWGKTSWGKIYGQWLVGSAVMVFDFDSFDSRQMVSVINRHGVTTFCAPPTIYRYMVMRGNASLPTLKHVTSAGEYLAPEVSRKFEQLTGLTIAEGYGQTELSLTIGNLAGDPPRRGSLGKAAPLYDISLIRDDGTQAPIGEPGQIVVRAKRGRQGLMLGYLSGDTISDEPIRDGALFTGDTARLDEDGYFWFNGRLDDVIKTGGFRVGPDEIEHILLAHPKVAECSVIGVPDPLRGQAIKARVVLVPHTEATEELKKELLLAANEQLAVYKRIRFLDFVEDLPKTQNGKIRRSGH
ncbi:MAG: AMP-binding protein [Thermoguttaceae bacterium]|nr:AMP-binding protein [Thermoguttaceae bacterium]MBQ6618807.1 AMP-binding protein [Thermoguttaceae bacterium]